MARRPVVIAISLTIAHIDRKRDCRSFPPLTTDVLALDVETLEKGRDCPGLFCCWRGSERPHETDLIGLALGANREPLGHSANALSIGT